jgi:hypothetical protein
LTGKPGERSGEISVWMLSLGNVFDRKIPKEVFTVIGLVLFKFELSLAVRLYACEGLGC